MTHYNTPKERAFKLFKILDYFSFFWAFWPGLPSAESPEQKGLSQLFGDPPQTKIQTLKLKNRFDSYWLFSL